MAPSLRTAVIIPFFQRTPGILARALASVSAQEVPPSAILVVDDGSPVSAEDELSGMPAIDRQRVTLLRQPNGGPGAARNLALDALDPGIEVVAFLDSDDQWAPDHLSRALRTLALGGDAFFADIIHLDRTDGALHRAGSLALSEHRPLGDDLYEYRGDMLAQVVERNALAIPTFAYRVDRFRTIRFRSRYRACGEDYLFFAEIAAAGARFAFSAQPTVRQGRGINVYSGSGWGSTGFLARTAEEIAYRRELDRLFALPPATRAVLHRKIKAQRDLFVRGAVHDLLRRRPVGAMLLKHLRQDPATAAQALPALLRLATGRQP